MKLPPVEVFEIARDGVQKMFTEKGASYTFPFDEIWSYAPRAAEVASLQRPGPRSRLVKEGLIEDTGEVTRAVSERRAGSATRRYRFGPALVPRQGNFIRSDATSSVTAPGAEHAIEDLRERMEAEGYIISSAELANFYLAMIVSPLVILSGISGTGKSLLPRQFARHTASTFFPIPVQPQWSDNADLFGYVPSIQPTQFVEGKLIRALRAAVDNHNQLVIVLLDEMNLAPVEHYFSDFLSVMETRQRYDGRISSDVLPIEIPPRPAEGEEQLSWLRSLRLPPNLRVVGTANMDYTTKSFSPKVLDRAFSIEFDDPNLTAFAVPASTGSSEPLHRLVAPLLDPSQPLTVLEARASNEELFDNVAALLQELQEILAPAGIKFGYRTRDSILMYLWHWRAQALQNVMTANAALDFCLLQKVLPKVGGTGQALGDSLDELLDWLRADRSGTDNESSDGFNGPFERSAAKVERMKALLSSDGATYFWGV